MKLKCFQSKLIKVQIVFLFIQTVSTDGLLTKLQHFFFKFDKLE